MMLKKRFLLIIAPSILIAPLSVISCSNNLSSSDAQIIITNIKNNNISVSIDNNSVITNILDLINEKLTFTVNKSENPSDTELKYYEELENSINNVSGEIIDFYLPKINEDINSSVFIKFNNNDNLICELSINKIYQNGKEINFIKNLTESEIQSLLSEKFSQDLNFISYLRNFFKNNVIDSYLNEYESNQQNGNSNFQFLDYWQKNEMAIINNLKNYLIKIYPHYFINEYYKNLYINIEAPSDQYVSETNNQKITIPNIKISTSDIALYPNCAYNVGELSFFYSLPIFK